MAQIEQQVEAQMLIALAEDTLNIRAGNDLGDNVSDGAVNGDQALEIQ